MRWRIGIRLIETACSDVDLIYEAIAFVADWRAALCAIGAYDVRRRMQNGRRLRYELDIALHERDPGNEGRARHIATGLAMTDQTRYGLAVRSIAGRTTITAT